MKKYGVFLVALMFVSMSLSVAQSHSGGPGIFYGYLGMQMANVNTTAHFDVSEPGIPEANTTIGLEDDLDFPSSNGLFYIKALAGTRFQIVGSYMSLHRSGEKNITRQFSYADQTYTVGANVKGYLNTDYYAASIRLSLLRTPLATAGFSLGGRYLMMSAGIDAASNGTSFAREGRYNVPVIVPGVHASVYILPGVLIRGSLEYFEMTLSGTKGRAVDAQVSAEYYLLKYLGAGIAYNYVDLRGQGLPDNDLYLRDINFTVKGISIYGALRF